MYFLLVVLELICIIINLVKVSSKVLLVTLIWFEAKKTTAAGTIIWKNTLCPSCKRCSIATNYRSCYYIFLYHVGTCSHQYCPTSCKEIFQWSCLFNSPPQTQDSWWWWYPFSYVSEMLSSFFHTWLLRCWADPYAIQDPWSIDIITCPHFNPESNKVGHHWKFYWYFFCEVLVLIYEVSLWNIWIGLNPIHGIGLNPFMTRVKID